ncbi:MAG TPA: hypothetical protein VK436_07030 [Methanocella sp.]|nr:hypothetical protein [Methanocella sp.]
MADPIKIKSFVQNVLGCGCSEEVFKHIEDSPQIYKGVGYTRINVGNRLLVYLLKTDDRHFIEQEIKGIVDTGIAERNATGFNRFRLAIVTTYPEEIGGLAEEIFHTLKTDDRTHIHVLGKGQADFF